jgi:O-antigen ligase
LGDGRSAETTLSLGNWVIPASLVLTIFVGLVARGANSAALAGLFSSVLCLIALAAVALSPKHAIDRLVRRHWIPALFLGLFIGYCTLSIFPNSILPPHPFFLKAGLQEGPASLAPYRTIEGLAALFVPVSGYIAGCLVSPTSETRDILFKLILLIAIPFGLYAFVQFSSSGGVDGRLSMNFGSANSAASTFTVLLLLCVGGTLRAYRRLHGASAINLIHRDPITIAALIVCIVGLLLTSSRAGQLASVGGVVLFFMLVVLFGKRTSSFGARRVALAVLLLSTTALTLFGAERFMSRFERASQDISTRELMISAHWGAFLDRPFVGHGLNTFHEVNAMIATPENWSALKTTGSAHNIYVQLLEETGIIGAILLASSLAAILWRSLFAAVGGSEWASAVSAAAAALLVHGLIDFGLQTPAVAALLAVALGSANGQSSQRSKKHQTGRGSDRQAPNAKSRPPLEMG